MAIMAKSSIFDKILDEIWIFLRNEKWRFWRQNSLEPKYSQILTGISSTTCCLSIHHLDDFVYNAYWQLFHYIFGVSSGLGFMFSHIGCATAFFWDVVRHKVCHVLDFFCLKLCDFCSLWKICHTIYNWCYCPVCSGWMVSCRTCPSLPKHLHVGVIPSWIRPRDAHCGDDGSMFVSQLLILLWSDCSRHCLCAIFSVTRIHAADILRFYQYHTAHLPSNYTLYCCVCPLQIFILVKSWC